VTLTFFSVTKNKNFKKPNGLLKNGQKKCPFLKSQNTFWNFLFSFLSKVKNRKVKRRIKYIFVCIHF
jgi:hypothetical protein